MNTRQLAEHGANACYFLSREFARAGHQVTIVTAQYGNLPWEERTVDGVLIFRVQCKRSNQEKSSFFEMLTYFVSAWKFTDGLLKSADFDKCLVFFGIPSTDCTAPQKQIWSFLYCPLWRRGHSRSTKKVPIYL